MWLSRNSRRLLHAAWLALAMAGCAATPTATRSAGKPAGPGTTGPEAPAAQTPAAPGAETATPGRDDEQVAFTTRYAHFQPASWNQLPGWREDRLAEAWAAFRRSCAALVRKQSWNGPCERSAAVAARSDEAIRQFFEREFALYEIRNADRSPEGVITGYYEPLINGSRRQIEPFIYPVYGTPDDLLTLDIRQLPRNLRGKQVPARIVGRTVIAEPGGSAPYLIDVGESQPDVRDKKLRVRLEGDRIVPYATRAEIERNGLANARVLVWVDNAAAFYSMQIQGSGKVRLPDGKVVRLAYAEQNGHPFMPPVAKGSAGAKKARVTTRGLSIELPDAEDEPANDTAAPEVPAAEEPLTRGLKSPQPTKPPRPLPRPSDPLPPDVERLVEELARGAAPAGRPVSAKPAVSPPPSVTSASSAPRPSSAKPATSAPMSFPKPSPALLSAISADPSYVFFREIPDSPEGPIGALGVSLTAGRSVAVDPRTTPLGHPVFVSTSLPGRTGQLNRLVMAQDTGGAIRGAVRADYFWGFGADAYAQAARMKEVGRMWLMLPHGQQVAARDQATRTRGLAASPADVDCVVADPDLCVEDR